MQLLDWGSCGHVETRVNICSEPRRDVCFFFRGHVRRLFAVLRWNDRQGNILEQSSVRRLEVSLIQV